MRLPRTLDQLAQKSERYIQRAKAGRRDRLLAASIFGLCDAIRDSADSEAAKDVAARIAADTESLVRLAHAGGAEMYSAWTQQREGVGQLRSIIARDRTD